MTVSIAFGDTRMPKHFWDAIEIDPVKGCWIRTRGHVTKKGYRYFSWNGYRTTAQRWSYHQFVADIPHWRHPSARGKTLWEVHHLCEVPPCCNPSHLELRDKYGHYLLGGSAAVASHIARVETGLCARGHDNWEIQPNGHWRCRTCYLDNIARANVARQQAIARARAILGMGHREYRKVHGQSRRVAQAIIDAAESV